MKRCEQCDLSTAALIMAFVCLDTMSFLAMPEAQTAQTRRDFLAWVKRYLKAHPDQPYQYAPLDVYAARCSTLHTFGAEAELHRQNPGIKKFVYTDGGKHAHDPSVSCEVVVIGLSSFINDVAIGVADFVDECRGDKALRCRVEHRLPNLFNLIPARRTHRDE